MYRHLPLVCAALAYSLFPMNSDAAETPNGNYDESKIPPYTLPDAFTCLDGTKVTDAKTWREKRRPELLELFQKNMHGGSPALPPELKFELTSTDAHALGGKATRKEITARFGEAADAASMHILLYVPNHAPKPAPAFVGVNFEGNHTVGTDPGITIREQWTWDNKTKTESLAKPDESTRGKSTGRWPVETILARGYAVAIIARADIEPDYAEGWKHGVRGFFLKKSGRSEFAPDDWGAISAWAWGLSRTLDYLETDKDIDAKHVAVVGHSRMGKVALWAGASDERFALVISNDSGEGGAALARRGIGETTAIMNDHFPHWFCGNFKQFSNHEDKMPFDQHELLALIAPRPLYVASAEDDKWADPRGEFLSTKHASGVWRLFGKNGVGVEEMPPVNHPAGDTVRYHIRTGKHDITEYDWEQYLDFADRQFGKEKVK